MPTSCTLYFVHEALKALEKRKFAVAFTLLRKPLKESLMFATWICADEEDFFENPLDNDVYATVYLRFAYVLAYLKFFRTLFTRE